MSRISKIQRLWSDGNRLSIARLLVRRGLKSKDPVQVKVNSHRIWVRPGTNDLDVATACLSGEFEPAIAAARPLEHRLIVDAGGYIGAAAIAFAEAFPDATVVTLEPARENFAILKKNVKRYPNIVAVNKALAVSKGSIDLVDRSTGEWGFSIVENPADSLQARRLYAVETTTIPALLQEFQADGIDMLKLDIEGGEHLLLRDNPAWVGSVRVIFAELHDRIVPDCTTVFAAATRGRRTAPSSGEKVLSVAA